MCVSWTFGGCLERILAWLSCAKTHWVVPMGVSVVFQLLGLWQKVRPCGPKLFAIRAAACDIVSQAFFALAPLRFPCPSHCTLTILLLEIALLHRHFALFLCTPLFRFPFICNSLTPSESEVPTVPWHCSSTARLLIHFCSGLSYLPGSTWYSRIFSP